MLLDNFGLRFGRCRVIDSNVRNTRVLRSGDVFPQERVTHLLLRISPLNDRVDSCGDEHPDRTKLEELGEGQKIMVMAWALAARTGAVYDRGYRPYDGPRGGRGAARLALYKASVRRAIGLRRSWRQKFLPLGLLAVDVRRRQ